MLNPVFYIIVIFLFYLSYIDLKTREVKNHLIVALVLSGLFYRLIINDFLSAIIGIILFSFIFIVLWKKETIGGADAKLAIALSPWLAFLGIPNMLATLWIFLIVLLVIGVIYSFLFKLFTSNYEYIPFIPAITITYIISLILRFS